VARIFTAPSSMPRSRHFWRRTKWLLPAQPLGPGLNDRRRHDRGTGASSAPGIGGHGSGANQFSDSEQSGMRQSSDECVLGYMTADVSPTRALLQPAAADPRSGTLPGCVVRGARCAGRRRKDDELPSQYAFTELFDHMRSVDACSWSRRFRPAFVL
jgi:hypothetical protein